MGVRDLSFGGSVGPAPGVGTEALSNSHRRTSASSLSSPRGWGWVGDMGAVTRGGGSWASRDEFIKNKLEIQEGQLMSAELLPGPGVIKNK